MNARGCCGTRPYSYHRVDCPSFTMEGLSKHPKHCEALQWFGGNCDTYVGTHRAEPTS